MIHKFNLKKKGGKEMIKLKKSAAAFTALLVAFCSIVASPALSTKATGSSSNSNVNGDWSSTYVSQETAEARLMTRVGDIDNFGKGWPTNFDPFTGNNTPVHTYPYTPESDDPQGTDRIMVVSGYHGGSSTDGYTSGTYGVRGYNTQVQPIKIPYDLNGLTVTDASLQIFVDDIQPSKWFKDGDTWKNGGHGGFTLNSYNQYQVMVYDWGSGQWKEISYFETAINALDQDGPIGKLVTLTFNSDDLYLIRNASGAGKGLQIKFDDPRTTVKDIHGNTVNNTGDGYAIDFAKLIIDKKGDTRYDGTITGKVYEATYNGTDLVLDRTKPIPNAQLTFTGVTESINSGSDGSYSCSIVPAGQVVINTVAPGFYAKADTIQTLIAGTTVTHDIGLVRITPAAPILSLNPAPPQQAQTVNVNISYPSDQTVTYVECKFTDESGTTTTTNYDKDKVPSLIPVTQNGKMAVRYKNLYGTWSLTGETDITNVDRGIPTAEVDVQIGDSDNESILTLKNPSEPITMLTPAPDMQVQS